jgi:hypothetical protein
MGSRCETGAAPATVTGDELGQNHWYGDARRAGKGPREDDPEVRRPDPRDRPLFSARAGVRGPEV